MKNGKRDLSILEGFEPYFYVRKDDYEFDDERIVRYEPTDFVGIEGEELKKLIVKTPGDVAEIRNFYEETWEADIPFTDRYKIDKQDELAKIPMCPRIMFFDIETMDVVVGSGNPILSIVAYDSFTKMYYSFAWHESVFQAESSIPDQEKRFIFQTEKEMLQKFLDFIIWSNPDILTGWYSNKFDVPYLLDRMENIRGIPMKDISPIGQVGTRFDEATIKGRICFDMKDGYGRVHENQVDSYKLDEVAKVELGIGKTGESAFAPELWKQGRLGELIDYNVNDVRLLVMLDEKLKLFDFYTNLAAKANVTLRETFQNSKLVDMYLLSLARKRKIALPTKVWSNDAGGIKGAKVFQPTKGLKHNLAVFDVKSLYPSIIITFNMSPETTLGCMDFSQEKEGLLPGALKELFAERQKLKDEGRNDQQRVVKEIMNSFYGVMLYKNFRLSNQEIGASITYVGRKILEWSADVVEAMPEGFKVVYGDTDSIFVEGVPDREKAEIIRLWINESYSKFVEKWGLTEHSFTIEFEAFVKAALFTGVKKKYVLLLDDDTMKIRGFETRRSNTTRLGRKVQHEVLDRIVHDETRPEILKYINDVKDNIKRGLVDTDDIGIPASITKPLGMYGNVQHIRAARYSNKYLKKEFGAGDKILLFRISKRPPKYPKTDIIALEFGDELPDGFVIDSSEHIKRSVDNLVKPILDAVGWGLCESKSLFDF